MRRTKQSCGENAAVVVWDRWEGIESDVAKGIGVSGRVFESASVESDATAKCVVTSARSRACMHREFVSGHGFGSECETGMGDLSEWDESGSVPRSAVQRVSQGNKDDYKRHRDILVVFSSLMKTKFNKLSTASTPSGRSHTPQRSCVHHRRVPLQAQRCQCRPLIEETLSSFRD